MGCEIADSESTYEQMTGANDSCRTKTIYLHLKKFFRGTRFTSVPFLRCLQEKHKEGDIVCVSGKVGFWVALFGYFVSSSMWFDKCDEQWFL